MLVVLGLLFVPFLISGKNVDSTDVLITIIAPPKKLLCLCSIDVSPLTTEMRSEYGRKLVSQGYFELCHEIPDTVKTYTSTITNDQGILQALAVHLLIPIHMPTCRSSSHLSLFVTGQGSP